MQVPLRLGTKSCDSRRALSFGARGYASLSGDEHLQVRSKAGGDKRLPRVAEPSVAFNKVGPGRRECGPAIGAMTCALVQATTRGGLGDHEFSCR
jgi:hypothetical protein